MPMTPEQRRRLWIAIERFACATGEASIAYVNEATGARAMDKRDRARVEIIEVIDELQRDVTP